MSVTLFAKSKKALALESPNPTDERPSKRAHADSEAHEPPTNVSTPHLTSASIGKQTLAAPSQIVSSKCGWEDLRMAPWVYKVCSELRYKNPTPIQQATIPLILDGVQTCLYLLLFFFLNNIIFFSLSQERTSWVVQRLAVVKRRPLVYQSFTNSHSTLSPCLLSFSRQHANSLYR